MNLSKYYGKNITPSCQYCLYYVDSSEENGKKICQKGKNTEKSAACGTFRYDPTLREPRVQPLPEEYSPEDFRI